MVYFEPGGDQVLTHPSLIGSDNSDLIKITDYEIGQENLVESKHYWLARSTRTGQSDLKPNATIRNRLNDILIYPPTQTLSSEELDLVWRYRQYLSANKKALTKFVKCINWKEPSLAAQAMDLINQWAPVDEADALELLGPSFTDPSLRQYAVNRIRNASDQDLQLYLLQLVQALKYEPLQEFDRHALYKEELDAIGKPAGAAVGAVSDGGGGPGEARSKPAAEEGKKESNGEGGLARFLIERACKNDVIASYFYWYLIVECEDSAKETGNEAESNNYSNRFAMAMYTTILHNFVGTLRNGPAEWQARAQFLTRQHVFVDKLVQLIKAVARESGARQKKIEKLQALLARESKDDPYSFVRFDPPLKLPVDPSVEVKGVIPSRASLFKSSLAPARLSFAQADTGDEYVIIFKVSTVERA